MRIDKKKYLIIPPCSDYNRGDQALVWETKRFAEDAGYVGDFYFMAEKGEPILQSNQHGMTAIPPILDHPSKRFKSKENITMSWSLVMKWGAASLMDLTWSLLLLAPIRFIILPFLSKEKKNTFGLFNDSDAVFVKGGGFIHSYGGKTALYYIYFQLYHIFLAQSLGKKVFICPNSFGPFEGFGVKWLVKKAFKKSELVTAREVRSSKMCESVLDIKVSVYPDFGFFLPSDAHIKKTEYLKKYNIPTDKKIVAITARPHRFPHSSDPKKAYDNFIRSIRGFSKWIFSEGMHPVFIEHVYALNHHEDDSYCINKILEGLDEGEYTYISDRTLNCKELKCVYGFFDYIVGTRFHSMIFSMSNLVPGIAITYVGNKGEGIMEDMRLEDYYLNINDVSEKSLIEKFTYLLNTEEKAKNCIKQYLQRSSDKRTRLVEIIKKK